MLRRRRLFGLAILPAMTTVTHSTHAMSHTARPTHSMCAMESRMGGPGGPLTVDSLGLFRMRRCLA